MFYKTVNLSRTDSEILGYALDTLQILLTVEEVEPDDDGWSSIDVIIAVISPSSLMLMMPS